MVIASVLILLSLTLRTSEATKPQILSSKTVPDTGNDWFSLKDRTEFQPAEAKDPAKTPRLREAQRRFLRYDEQFIDGGETYYDEYAQAWRMIGMYIDCNVEEYVDQEEGEGQEQQEAEENQDGDDAYSNMGGCQRYLLWAAVSDM